MTTAHVILISSLRDGMLFAIIQVALTVSQISTTVPQIATTVPQVALTVSR